KAHREQRGEIARELTPLGTEVAVYLADVLESLDDDTLVVVGPMLAEMKNHEALPLLRRALGSGRSAVKAQAIVALSPLALTEDAGLLLPLLSDPDPGVAGGALDTLSRLGSKAALEPAVKLCSSEDATLRSRAFAAVVDIARKTQQEAELPHLFRDILEQAQGVKRAEIVLQLGGAGSKALSGLLVRFLRDDDAQVRAATAQALGNIGDPGINADVLNAVQVERDKWARVALAGASVRLVVREAIDPIIGWLEDSDADVRIAAQRSLRGLTGANLGLDPEEWRTWRKENPK
ncbi:MAG TPA: HEAT repeat domain-containing protein, partial [Planctomycetota bacterium]|nr:HEAT repeat domain-containing protein [Planctomycetota bacterium]